ncbi:hypothetical protein, partial [Pararhodospirillum oryzae]|uniref:hypothetical protein n=1 Tax=Pararhodospirillum oryzae TaxID=478448 RepID=UPI001C3F9B49
MKRETFVIAHDDDTPPPAAPPLAPPPPAGFLSAWRARLGGRPRALVLADGVPALLVEPGQPPRELADGTDPGPGGPLHLFTDAADLRVEDETLPPVAPWLRPGLRSSRARALVAPGGAARVRLRAEPPGLRLV